MPRTHSRRSPGKSPPSKKPSRRGRNGFAGGDPGLSLLAECATEYALVMLDAEGRIVAWHENARRIHGHEPREIVGQHLEQLFSPEDRARGLPAQLLAQAGRAARALHTGDYVRRNGERFAVRADIRAQRDGAGRLLGFAHVTRDLTCDPSGRAQPDRTGTDAQPDPDAGRDAQNAQQAASDFFAMISHEIRTPLTNIKGFVEILVAQELSPLQRRYVDLAQASCAALMTIVDDVLDFAKIESGQIDLNPAPVSLAQLTHGVLSSVLGTAGPKGLALAVKIAPDVPPSLLADADRLRQILLNLLTNAVKFTLRGSVTLTVTHEGTSEAGERVRFAVVDTGIGIPDNRLDRLFTRFSQADRDIRHHFGGTGLGLAICKQLVERMGGEIGIETALGRGSTFWFTLTLPRAPAAAAAPARGMPAPAPSKHVKLLLVEDRVMNQEIARVFLEHAGYQVEVVDSGPAAISAVQTAPFDAVLMDLRMPDMDGLEATRRIRGLGGDVARMPIIAMSAGVLPADVDACYAAGMNDHIGKPFDREEMYRVIERWTAKH